MHAIWRINGSKIVKRVLKNLRKIKCDFRIWCGKKKKIHRIMGKIHRFIKQWILQNSWRNLKSLLHVALQQNQEFIFPRFINNCERRIGVNF